MASLIEGYEYDIFISYRQKDNKYDGWVTEFVNNLKCELEATFKEEIGVYFDINPHDGLLETHDVDASLKDKLKCLVFIPIISRTYCDPKSFAWEHEFKAFIELASRDQFGLKVKLPGGNVANRVLPVQIHELDANDRKLVENELGGFLRGIEFIYKEPGVNRPLMSNESHPDNNLNKTFYRNQINKVANAIKDIIAGLKNPAQDREKISGVIDEEKRSLRGKLRSKIISTLILMALIVAGYLIIPRLIKPKEQLEKSIAVLPFKSFSDDPEKQYLADGMMDAILLHLSKIEDLRVISRTSVEQYRKTNKTTSTIGKELGVTYLLEGSFQKYDDTARLIVQLIKTGKETHEWANQYDRKWSDIFFVQSEVSQAIANELKAIVTPVEQQLIEKKPTQDLTAYEAYLKGRFYEKSFNLIELDTALYYFEMAKEKDPEFALAYAGIAYVWLARQQIELVPPEEAGPKAMAALKRASELDNTLADVHYFMGVVYQFSTWDWESAESEYKKTIEINPNYAEAYMMYSILLSLWGRNEEALENFELALKLDPFDPLINLMYCSALLNARQYEACITACRREIEKNQTNFIAYEPLYNALYLKGKYEESLEAMGLHYMGVLPKFNHVFDQYKKLGYVGTLNLEIDTLIAQSKSKPLSPQFLIELYFFAGNKERALDCMEQAYEWHDPNLPGQIVRPTYESLCNEPRYQELLGKLNLPKCN
jgi:TolB-like protein